jgi:transcriptional regulator with XRE-family HTH domain
MALENRTYLKTVGRKIKSVRKEKKYTQAKLASLCSFQTATMSRIESGEVNMSILTVKIISNNLNISLEKLFEE